MKPSSPDILEEVTRALREETSLRVAPPTAEATYHRIQTTVRTRARRRQAAVRGLGVLLLATLGSTGWAFVTGRIAWKPSAPPASPAPPAASRSAPSVPRLEPARSEVTAPRESPVPSAPRAEPSPRRRNEDLELYRAAHALHFETRDFSAALDLWTRYLGRFPEGTFAREAAFNRAVCLVRLQRFAEATEALEPFASGRYGGYRQAEAEAILGALRTGRRR